jgi:hypothetical protein
MTPIHVIQQLLDPYDDTQTEADGLTRICNTVLVEHGIKHQPMAGTLARPKLNQLMPIHLWIDLPTGDRIDYRARMWLGNDGVPHGIFKPQDFPDIIYKGSPIDLEPLPPEVFAALIFKFEGFPNS